MRKRTALCVSTAIALGLTIAACGGGGGGSGGGGSSANGMLTVQATDAPFAHGVVTSAEIEVSRIEIHSSGTASSGFTTIFDASVAGQPVKIDLMNLRNGATQALVSAMLPAGTYRQLRYIVSAAELTLTNGNAYSTATGNLDLPSGMSSGLKVFLDPPVLVTGGQSTTLLLDFDLTRTYLPIPANDALTATRYMLRPVIRAANASTAGAIQGTVRDAANANAPVAGATVEVFTAGTTTSPVATTGTDAGGSYTILAVPPGSYDVVATITTASATRSATVLARSVTVGNVTTVDITVP